MNARLHLALSVALGAAACSGDEPTTLPTPITIDTASLASAQIGVPYDVALTASKGTARDYQWSVTSGALPDGLELRARGTPSTRISGTPTVAGAFSFTVTVEDSAGTTQEQAFTIDVAGERPELEIVTLELPNGATRAAYEATVQAAGGTEEDYRWRLVGGALPAGLTLTLQGTPSATLSGTIPRGAEGDYEFTLEVRDSGNNRASIVYEITIVDDSEPLVFTTATLPAGEVAQPYDETIAIGGGLAPYDWRVSSGRMPPGLSLDVAADGRSAQVVGTPSQSDRFTFQVEVVDAEEVRARKTYFLQIDAAPSAVRIVTTELPRGEQGTPFSATITALQGVAPYTWALVGSTLPTGLTLAASGTPSTTISGTPQTNGTFELHVEVTDARGQTADRTFFLQVAERVVPISIVGGGQTIVLADAVGGEPYTATLTAADGFGLYNWVVTEGALPPGLRLQVPGTPSTVITGIATALGTYTATITVFDWNNVTASVPVRISVDPPTTLPTIATTSVPDAPICGSYRTTIQASGGSNANYAWSVVNGALPPGFALTSGTPAATITGVTGTQVGSYAFTVRVTDTFGLTDDLSVSIDVLDIPGGQRWVAAVGDFFASAEDRIVVGEICTPGVPTPIDVSPSNIPTGGSVDYGTFSVAFSPNGRALAYIGDVAVDGQDDVFVVDLTSGTPSAPIVVSDGLGFSGVQSAVDLRWSPDGTKLAFRADVTTSLAEELFVVDLTDPSSPGMARRVSSAYSSSSTEVYLPDYYFSPDGTKIAFIADEVSADDMLYFVDLSALPTGGMPGPLTPVVAAPPSFTDMNGSFQWTPDSRALIYNADFEAAGVNELFWVDTTGGLLGAPIVISGPMVSSGGVQINSTTDHWPYWSVSPDGTKVFYVADQEVDSANALYIVDISGTVPGPWQRATIEQPIPNLGILSAKWSPDSQRIAMRGDLQVLNAEELFMVNVSGTLPQPLVKISATPSNLANEVGADAKLDYEFSPDGTRIAYIADLTIDGAEELFMVNLQDGAPYQSRRINTPAATTSNDVVNFQWAPDGQRIAFVGTMSAASQYELYVVQVTGGNIGPMRRVHAPAASTTGDLSVNTSWVGNWDWFWTADSQRLVYEGAFATIGADEVWISDVTVPQPVMQRVGPPNTDINRDVYRMFSQGAYARLSYLP